MTPPDSDAAIQHECQCGYRIVGRDVKGSHTWSKCKPDSDAEVCGCICHGRNGQPYCAHCEPPDSGKEKA